VALCVDGSSGKLADLRVEERIRYEDIPDDRGFGADSPGEAVSLVSAWIARSTRHHARLPADLAEAGVDR
jgi:hypothetical protein